MRFGFTPCVQVPPDGTGFGRIVPQIVEQARQAERCGFDAVLFPEHHQQRDSYLPSPLVMAAAVAASTSRIKVGTGIAALPLYHAIRVAEDAAVIDQLSNGRLILGLGAGSADVNLRAYGVPKSQLSGLMEEGLAVLSRAWTEDNWSFSGQHYQLENVMITPKPVQRPRPPLWLGGWTRSGIERAARLGDGWLCDIVSRVDTLAESARNYRRLCRKLGRIGRIAVLREGYCAPSTEQALVEYGAPLLDYHFHYYQAGRYNAAAEPWLRDVRSAKDFTLDRVREDRFILGSPEDCIREIDRYRGQLGVEYIIFRSQRPAGPSHEQVMESIRLFGEKVIPHYATSQNDEETLGPSI